MKLSISIASISVALVAAAATTGCKKEKPSTGGTGSAANTTNTANTANTAMSGSIALLLPESQTARYEAADHPFFEAKFKELCPGVEVIYSNANQKATDQQQQAEAAIAKGVKVIVLDPVDGDAAGGIVNTARSSATIA
jgi:D-xylose transport system substrate-binding protein